LGLFGRIVGPTLLSDIRNWVRSALDNWLRSTKLGSFGAGELGSVVEIGFVRANREAPLVVGFGGFASPAPRMGSSHLEIAKVRGRKLTTKSAE
jgi:hypothetical protein